MSNVVSAYVLAVTDRPRSLATSWRTAFALRVARRHPALADRIVLRSMARLGRPDPSFVLTREQLAARAAARESVVR
jgi:hypothetical protein